MENLLRYILFAKQRMKIGPIENNERLEERKSSPRGGTPGRILISLNQSAAAPS